MTVEDLRKIVHATPFRAFTMHLAARRRISVPHPDFIAIGGQGHTVIVTNENETLWNLADLLLVTDVEVEGSAPATH